MRAASAFYSDGRTAARRAVWLMEDARGLIILGQAGETAARWPWEEVRMAGHRLAGGGAILTRLPERRERLTIANAAFVAAAAERQPALKQGGRSVSRGGAVVAVAVAAVVAAAFLGFSQIAPVVAALVPAELERRIGESAVSKVAILMGADAGERCTGPDGRAALEALVARLAAAADAGDVAVEVIPSATANAFAVPGGRIVVLGGLFKMTESGDALAGVLAHEMAHVALDHPTIGLVRQEAVGMAKLVFLGDTGTTGDLGGLMVQFAYTRDMETEADREAIGILQRAGLTTAGLAQFLATVEAKRGGRTPLAALMSTHPATGVRRAQVEAMTETMTEAGGESVDAATFEAIKRMCAEPAP